MYQSLRVSIHSQTMPPEDNAAHGDNYAFVFDGLGGTGGGKRLNEKGESISEAKIASGAAADALNQWARENWERWRDALASAGNPDALTASIVREVGAAFNQGLREAAQRYDAQKLPTTVAGWLTFPAPDGKTLAIALWAGDSRCYTLDADSMKLYSRDDADKSRRRDAMQDCLNGDSLPMNNRMGIDNQWRLNYNYNTFEGPVLLLSCTDGFYNCMESPMHLEYYLRLLGGWEASDDVAEWKPESFEDMGNQWKQFILEGNLFADDSATLETIFIAPDPENITALRALLSSAARVRELEETYIAPFPEEYQARTFPDLDAQIRDAAKKLCAENDAYGFLHALRENAIRLAQNSAAPLDKNIPCADTVEKMRSQRQIYGEARQRKRENLAERKRQAEEELDRRIKRLTKRGLQSFKMEHPPFEKLKDMSEADILESANSCPNKMIPPINRLYVEHLKSAYNPYYQPVGTDSDFLSLYENLAYFCALINRWMDIRAIPRSYPRFSAAAFRTRETRERLSQSERESLKRALLDAMESGQAASDAFPANMNVNAREMLDIFASASKYEFCRRVLENFDAEPDADNTDSYAKFFDDYLSVNRLRDAKYILESWIERGEMPEGYRFPSALAAILNKNAAALRERKAANDAVIERHKRLDEDKIKLWERYKPDFEAFAEPPLYVDVSDKRKDIRETDGPGDADGGANDGRRKP